ncbi:MAG TPA: hypothetical protein ENH12_04420, partial [Proteobacteria bacterium]|nr:hypothetical protein [Pseudomonadota bacterium]
MNIKPTLKFVPSPARKGIGSIPHSLFPIPQIKRHLKIILLILPLLTLFLSCSPTGVKEKVIVLAFDGMDPRIVQSMFEDGKLQNFKKVAEMGGFKYLWSSIPPQSPVAWSNFITGQNPGGHAIFDFIHRDPKTYMPYLSMSETLPPTTTIKPGSYVFPLSGGQVLLKREGKA